MKSCESILCNSNYCAYHFLNIVHWAVVIGQKIFTLYFCLVSGGVMFTDWAFLNYIPNECMQSIKFFDIINFGLHTLQGTFYKGIHVAVVNVFSWLEGKIMLVVWCCINMSCELKWKKFTITRNTCKKSHQCDARQWIIQLSKGLVFPCCHSCCRLHVIVINCWDDHSLD
jgi:hypothetical protein